jgi:hypothetical protein
MQAKLRTITGQLLAGMVSQLGARTTAQSPAVNIASDDAQIGTKVTAITALASGGTGLIGWLSQIWNELATNGIRLLSQGVSASATFTPAAASHLANDCNGAAGTFALGAVSASRVMITGATLEIDGGTAEATAWRLYLYNVTPPSATADDGAWDLVSGDRASYLGYIDLGTAVDMGSTQWVETSGINKQIKLSGTGVFGYLVNLTTLTPAAVAHIVTLHAVQV